MSKSKYADRFRLGLPLLDEIMDEQIGRLSRQAPKDRNSTLEDWVDLAGAESDVKDRYQGRYLFELIQNANDAVVDAQLEAGDGSSSHPRVRVDLNSNSLLVANCGKPFDQNNVRSLCRLHNTTKTASKQIGHKGIGFKSVLEICDRPEVYSDVFAFGYDGMQFRKDVVDVMGPRWNSNVPLPILRAPYPRYINQLSPGERARVESHFDDGFVTVVRLPLDDPQLVTQVSQRMERDIGPSLLLFLPAVSQIELRFPDGRDVIYYRVIREMDDKRMQIVVLFRSDSGEDRVDSRWLMLGPIQRPLPKRSLLADLDDKWRKAWQDVTGLRFALAFPLSDDVKTPRTSSGSEPFYVYYPTEEFSGLRFAVHADFHVGSDRKTLGLNKLNKWLIEEICLFLAGEGVELLKGFWSEGTDLVDMLAPLRQPERDFARHFMRGYLKTLGMAELVRTRTGHYKTPENSRFPPSGVDQTEFRELFYPTRLRGSAEWTYPAPEIVEQERDRDPPFLLGEELGAQVISPAMVAEALKRDGMPSLDESEHLIALVAHWYDNLPRRERPDFVALFRDLPILPTTTGWKRPDDGVVFQANLRPNVPDIVPPAGFDFSVIRKSVYPEGGTRSIQYRLFRELDAREYSSRSVVRDILLPVLTDEKQFDRLIAEHPQAIFEAYVILVQYFEEERSAEEFRDKLRLVPVPATDGRPDGWSGWKPAGACYFGKNWPRGEVLEAIYAGFDGCYFLREIPEHVRSAHSENQLFPAEFFRWLGVMDQPEVKSVEHRIQGGAGDPFERSLLWADYMETYSDHFICPNPRKKHHGSSRRLQYAHSLGHFPDLVEEGDRQKLIDLYGLLARDWDDYRRFRDSSLKCRYVSTNCPSERIENYFLYQLRHAPWLPAQIGEHWVDPLPPDRIWFLGETDPTEVRNLVPTFPDELRVGQYREFASDLGFISSSRARIEDYLRLLQLLPERYPLEPEGLSEDELKRWQRSVRSVFNWICERIQTGLVARGEDEGLRQPAGLKVLAYRDEDLEYVSVGDLRLVYPDDSFAEGRWKKHCTYLRINDDWQRLRDWLAVPSLSEVLDPEWRWDGELVDETAELKRRFQEALPYYLALIKNSQPANYDRLLSRLQRLRIHVVKRLTVEESLGDVPDVPAIRSEQRLHLKKTDDPNPRGGPPVRGGDLYVVPQVLDNLDLLGSYIAEYVEIARLADAFVILVNRDSDEGKIRFVQSKGINQGFLQSVLVDLESEGRGAGGDNAWQYLRKALSGLAESVEGKDIEPTRPAGRSEEEEEPFADEEPEERETKQVEEQPTEVPEAEWELDYPDLNLEDLPDTEWADPERLPTVGPTPGTPGSGNGGGGPRDIVPEEVKGEIGRRGEHWAYEIERQRLARLGFDPSELEEMGELVWVSQDQPTANHDICSIRVTEAGEQRTVYIEVKASTGNQRKIRMGKGEFELALSLGEDYWLYWVGNVDRAQPDPPICYPNVAKLVAEQKVVLNVASISLTLPK